MSSESRLIPSSSQTVGPFFRIGLEHLMDRAPAGRSGVIVIRGKVLDRDGAPVPDAMIEFWTAAFAGTPDTDGSPVGFRRVGTDVDGAFSVSIPRPPALVAPDGSTQAPHLLALVFARGLLRHLVTRVYFEDEAANVSDSVLLSVPADRRNTLTAARQGADEFRWDVRLQGPDETVFFAW